MTKQKMSKAEIIACIVLLIAIAAVLIFAAVRKAAEPETAPDIPAAEQKAEEPMHLFNIVETENEVTAEVIQDGLRDMGRLITQEYYFTEVINDTKVKSLWNLNLPFTESGFVASYDGVITAGVSFGDITVEKDDEAGTVTVHIPKAEIFNVDIDPESFVLYSEKQSRFNPFGAEDFNASLVELEATARQKATDRGLLEKADENAVKLVENFVRGILGNEYTLTVETAG